MSGRICERAGVTGLSRVGGRGLNPFIFILNQWYKGTGAVSKGVAKSFSLWGKERYGAVWSNFAADELRSVAFCDCGAGSVDVDG